jgi:hypothetical protein
VKPPVLWSVLTVALITGPYYFLVYRFHWQTTVMNLTDAKVSGIAKAVFYWRTLPGQLGWTLLALSLLGLVTSPRWDRRTTTLLMLTWIGSGCVMFTLIGLKSPRHMLYWLPPFTYFAAGLLTRMFPRQPLRAIAGGAAVLLLGSSLVIGWRYERPYVSGYSAAAKAVTQAASGGVILYDCDLPGNFIFFLRTNDPQRHFLVLRKALYTFRINKRWGSQELVHDREGIEDLLRRSGVRFVIVSEHMHLNFGVQRTLRDMLRSKPFRLLGRFPIYSTQQPADTLLLYENELWAPPTDKFLKIRMLTLKDDIVVPFSQFDLREDRTQPPLVDGESLQNDAH